MKPNRSFGSSICRTSFNPSAVSAVDQIKEKTAEIINLLETIKDKDPRLFEIALQQ